MSAWKMVSIYILFFRNPSHFIKRMGIMVKGKIIDIPEHMFRPLMQDISIVGICFAVKSEDIISLVIPEASVLYQDFSNIFAIHFIFWFWNKNATDHTEVSN